MGTARIENFARTASASGAARKENVVTSEEIIKALRCLRVETGSLSCLGCGHEHSCNVHGCQILREAAAQLEHFIAENRALRSALASRPAKRAQKQARDASVTFLREMAKELNAQRAEAEAERDAAIVDLKIFAGCSACRHCCDHRRDHQESLLLISQRTVSASARSATRRTFLTASAGSWWWRM